MSRLLLSLFCLCFALNPFLASLSASSLAPSSRSDDLLPSAVSAVSLSFSSYLGGSTEDSIRDLATDSSGNIFIAGGTASPNFPATPGSFDSSFNGTHDAFVAKLDPSGSLIWATFIGGPNYDRAYALEVDPSGNVFIAGRAGAGFPTSQSALQRSFAGDLVPNLAYGQQDGFIAKLSSDGRNLIWATYFGSDGRDFIRDCDIDSSGNVYIGVSNVSRNHPHLTAGSFQTQRRGASDGMAAKISANGSSVIWASYFGGGADDGGAPSVRVDATGNLYYLTNTNSTDAPTTVGAYKRTPGGGWDLVAAKFNASGSSIIYGTYLGGGGLDFTETHGLAIDGAGNAYVAMSTMSAAMATTTGAFQSSYGGSGGSGTGSNSNYPGDAYVAKLSANGTQLLAATYLGGRHGEGAEGIMLDGGGNVFVSGATYSDNFPVTSGAYQTNLMGRADVFAVKLTGDLRQLSYSSYIGGHLEDHGRTAAIDGSGNFYVAGASNSVDWPVNNPVQSSFGGDADAVLAKFTLTEDGPSLLPIITGANVSGKKLFVIGENFGAGAAILLNNERQKKTFNDNNSPTTMLVAKKAGKKIAVGDTVRLQVRNPDGRLSEVFSFTRPPNNN
jgi:hypothetical protein